MDLYSRMLLIQVGDNNIRVYSISKDSYYGQYMISNNYYYVLFYDINDIPSKYL